MAQSEVITYAQVAHAMGPINGELYTNSLEAFRLNYAHGFRVFEVDIVRLADGQFVAAHPGLEERYGCCSFDQICISDFPASFLGFSTLTWESLVELLGKFPEIKFIVDIKDGHAEFYSLCSRYKNRIIPQFYTREHLAVYSKQFKNYVLAYCGYDGTEEELIDDCLKYSVNVVSLNKSYRKSTLHQALVGINVRIMWYGELYAPDGIGLLNDGDAAMLDCHYIVDTVESGDHVAKMQFVARAVATSFYVNLGRKPDFVGLWHYSTMLMRHQIDVQELSGILSRSSEGELYSTRRNQNAPLSFIDPSLLLELVNSFYEVFYKRKADLSINDFSLDRLKKSANPVREFFDACGSSSEFKSRQLYFPVSGQYDDEGDFCWFNKSATVVVKDIPLYISIPDNFPTSQNLVLSTTTALRKATLRPGEAIKVRNASDFKAEVWSIEAENVYKPSCAGSSDVRSLAFQVSVGTRDLLVLRDKRPAKAKFPLVAVSGSIKEKRVLAILANELQGMGIACISFDENSDEFKSYVKSRKGLVFLVASADTFFLCERLVDSARYIYIEHGIAPFKGYTYGAHYKNYDHVLLPSQFWANRIEKLHGKLESFDVVGYPVIASVSMSKRKNIDLLVAPTWSRNVAQMQQIQTVVQAALTAGLKVGYAGHPDSIASISETLLSKLVPVDDVYVALGKSSVVLTDFSSIGIEAAALDVPVLVVSPLALDDFDKEYFIDGSIEVPYSNKVLWDIGPEVNDKNFLDEFSNVRRGSQKELFGARRRDWAKFCHGVTVAESPRIAAASVVKYLDKL